MEYEVFVPPCLAGDPPRPQWAGTLPPSVAYGSQFSVSYSLIVGQTLGRVVLMAPAALTHHHDSNQRYVELDIEAINLTNTGALINAPVNATRAPPGWYMIFLISSSGVPSEARWLQLGM